jgi:hypothetical protein
VLAVVDAGVDPVVLAPPVPVPAPAPAAPVAEADVDVVVVGVDEKPKSGPGAAADVVVVVANDEPWEEGDPNEKPTLPAFGGVDPSLLPGATPNPNEAGVVDAAAPPKGNGEDLEGKPNGVVGGPPNTLPGCSGGKSPAWSFFSLSSAGFIVAAPNMLLEPPKEPPVVVAAVSPNNFEPGATLKAKGDGADEAGLSLSFSSKVDLSDPKSGPFFGGPLKSKVLVAPLLLPPKEKGADSFVATGLS